MKKIALFLALVVTISVTSCSTSNSSGDDKPAEAKPLFSLINKKNFDSGVKPHCQDVGKIIEKFAPSAKFAEANKTAKAAQFWSPETAKSLLNHLYSYQKYADGVGQIMRPVNDLLRPTYLDVVTSSDSIAVTQRGIVLQRYYKDFFSAGLATCGLAPRMKELTSYAVLYKKSYAMAKTAADAAPEVIDTGSDVGYAAWYPSGYTESDDGETAYKWFHTNSCQSGDSCNHAKFIALYGCPNGLYAEVNFLDKNDNVVDWSNDSVPSLDAGQTAVFEFSTYDSDASTAQMTTVNCHS